MIEVKVGGLIPDKKSGSHVLLLKVPNSSKYLPIWIGPAEASAIAMALRNQSFERPLTHDLLVHLIDGLGAKVTRIVITTIKHNTFFARIFLSRDNEIISIDARPSDSVAIAVRVNCPIFLTEELLASQSDNLYEIEEESASVSSTDLDAPASGVSSLEELLRSVERGESFEAEAGREESDESDDEDDEPRSED